MATAFLKKSKVWQLQYCKFQLSPPSTWRREAREWGPAPEAKAGQQEVAHGYTKKCYIKVKPSLWPLGKGGWPSAAYLMFHDGGTLSDYTLTSLPMCLRGGAGLRLLSRSPLHAVFAHFGTQRSTTWCRQDSVPGREFHKLSNNLPSRACTPALPQQRLSSYLSCIVMLNNAVKRGEKSLSSLPLPQKSFRFGLCLCKTLSTGDWHVCFNHSLLNDLNYHVVKKWVLVLEKNCTFKIQLVNTAKNCILYFYFQHVVLYIKFIEIEN